MKKNTLLKQIKLVAIGLIFISSNSFAQNEKEWGMVLDEDINTLSKVDDFGFYGSFGFGYTPEGRLWKTSDGGKNWGYKTISGFSPEYPGKLELIKQVHYFDSLNGIHRFDKNVYYKTTDGGATLTLLSRENYSDYTFTSLPNTHFANQNVWYKWARALRLSDSKLVDVILLTTDGGTTWSDISENLYTNYPSGKNWIAEYVQFVSATVGFVFGQEGFYKTTDGGKTWSLANTLRGSGPIDFIDANTGYIAKHFALFDEVYKTTDGGTTFTATTLTDQIEFKTQNITEIYSIDFYDINNGVAACIANGMPFIARTTDAGQTWIQDTIASSILSISSVFSGFKPIQMVSPDAAFTQIVANTSKRYIIGFGNSDNTPNSIGNTEFEQIKFYPNPCTYGQLNIDAKGSYDVLILNVNGQLVDRKNELNNFSTLDLNILNSGLYTIQIIGEDYSVTKKILVK